MTRIMLLALLLALMAESASGVQEDDWQVVVQDAYPRTILAVSADEKFVAAYSYHAPHILHLIDLELKRVIHVNRLQEQILAATFAHNDKSLIVSTRESIYELSVDTSNVRQLLSNVKGFIALSEDDSQLAVLGMLEKPGSLHINLPRKPLQFGVYDLAKKEWISNCNTPILSPQRVAFDGQTAVAYGCGGSMGNRGGDETFECDVRLDPLGEKPQIAYGPIVSGRMHTSGYGGEFGGYGGYRGEVGVRRILHSPERSGYRPPGVFRELRIREQEARWSLSYMMLEMFPHGEIPAARPAVGFLSQENLIKTLIKIPRSAVYLSLSRDGKIELSSSLAKVSEKITVCGDRFVELVRTNSGHEVVNLVHSKTLLKWKKERNRQDRPYFFENGCLLQLGDQMSFYNLHDTKPVWTTKPPFSMKHLARVIASPNGELIGLSSVGGTQDVLFVYAAKNGQLVSRIPRLHGLRHRNRSRSVAFKNDGTRLAMLLEDSLLIYDTKDGNLLCEEKKEKQAFYRVLAVGDQWLVVHGSTASFYSEENGFGKTIAHPEIVRATFTNALGKPAIIVESKYESHSALVDFSSGKVLTKWYANKLRPFAGQELAPPQYVVGFEGKILARSIGAAAIELVRLQDLKSIATIQTVRVDENLEWVTFTPDGYWSATDKAKPLVTVINNGKLAKADEFLSRFNPSLVAERIRMAAEGN